jgi:hypothetical protein
MCNSYGYRSLPFLLAIISLMEMVLGILRIVVFFSPKSSTYTTDTAIFPANSVVPSPLLLSKQSCAAFALDWIGSIIPTFMGIYVTIFILVAACSVCVTCLTVCKAFTSKNADCDGCTKCWALVGLMCINKPNHRCVSLTCNCPCYTARPRLRFQVRFALLGFFVGLRIIAIIVYASDKKTGIYGGYMAAICTGSLALLSLTMGLDYYQYRVWWYYRPDGSYQKCRCLCCKQHFHESHRRFLPMPLLGKHRSTDKLGDEPCAQTVSGYCPNLSLEHVVIFHAYNYIPQRRYQPGSDLPYIAFHQTTPEAGVSIAKTGFRISDKPPQMLGFGIYFARSFEDTENKARNKGKLLTLINILFFIIAII